MAARTNGRYAVKVYSNPALLPLKDYVRQKKQGLDPVFDPKALGIKNADFWKKKYVQRR